eukprot:scaffold132308_cov17-Prasinocladus_malaysianus.AAC.2
MATIIWYVGRLAVCLQKKQSQSKHPPNVIDRHVSQGIDLWRQQPRTDTLRGDAVMTADNHDTCSCDE